MTQKALHCNHCKVLLLIPERPMHQVVSGFPEAEATFRAAHLHLERLLSAKIEDSPRTTIMEQSLPWVWEFCFHSLATFTATERRTVDWMMKPDPQEISLDRKSAQEAAIALGGGDKQDILAILHRLDELTQILRSIQHRLHERVRAICGHQKLEDLDCGAFDRNSGFPESYLGMLSGDCPCCACLRWWRAQVSVYFGLRDYLRSCVDQHQQAQFFSLITDLIPLEPRHMAKMALAMFAYQARSMLRLMHHLANGTASDSKHTGEVDRSKFTWLPGPHPQLWHLNLWLGRMPDPSVKLSDSERSCYSYLSMHGAWQALEQSILLHRQHLTQLDPQLRWLVTKHPNPGRWYAQMALNHRRQFWSRALR